MVKRILIVDDETSFLYAYQRLLRVLEVQVDTADCPKSAEALLNQFQYDVAMVDVRLSGTNAQEGLEILKRIKDKTPGTGVIIMTAYSDPGTRERAFRWGADFYFEKPLSFTHLKIAIHHLGIG